MSTGGIGTSPALGRQQVFQPLHARLCRRRTASTCSRSGARPASRSSTLGVGQQHLGAAVLQRIGHGSSATASAFIATATAPMEVAAMKASIHSG
jgi:hypothetical protein